MNKPLILVVEDDPSIRNLITTTLKTNDYRYVVAPSGSTAIMEATSHNPEIILLDLGLPDMDGVQVIQTVLIFILIIRIESVFIQIHSVYIFYKFIRYANSCVILIPQIIRIGP